MDRPEIVIRDIHRHGEALTVPAAIAAIPARYLILGSVWRTKCTDHNCE